MLEKLKAKFVKQDGTIDAGTAAGAISLLLILGQQVFAAFGIKFQGDLNTIVAAINTLLMFLGLIGIMSGDGTVSVDTTAIERKVADAHQTALTAASAVTAIKPAVTEATKTASDAKAQATKALKIVDPKNYQAVLAAKPISEWIDKDGNVITSDDQTK
ncbi:hypothetical protein [Liquorilactobacillus uvarum]|uniref:hypothetical protein n=1 Tax=Liquorilactobacillus uvarum TaxID=303240 RepID=UPI00288A91AC|nr:hypothetical protein [Liquorilactobacillus uvarum]